MAENNNALSHQEIGRNLKLFFFDDVSPGSCFFLRGGQYVYNRLIEMIRYLYNNNDYNEVSTPIICNSLLWKTSGHYEKYRENMFFLEKDGEEESSLCPMNCISGDALISLENGNQMQIKHMNNENNILGYDRKSKCIKSATQTAFYNKGKKQCIELLFIDGRKLICTPEHKLLTSLGWIEANNLISNNSNVYAIDKNKKLFELRLIDKNDAGIRDVYDISVGDDINSFVANGLVVHNCPKHIMMYKHIVPSYRDLPIRIADFGPLHRNEASGALRGLTRVRLFHQDDAHIFCKPEDVENEIDTVINMMMDVYKVFKFDVEIAISTRPDNYIGDISLWDNAEKILIDVVKRRTDNFTIKEKDGAFYGPKIDIMVSDSIGRKHQLGTVQLDFNLPQRFQLKYKRNDGEDHQPIIVHRAILGSLERFIAILLEHTQGSLPLWLSPRKVAIMPVNEKQLERCKEIGKMIQQKLGNKIGIDVLSEQTVNKLIRETEIMKYNFICVIGNKELANNTITVRSGNTVHGEKDVNEFIEQLYHMNQIHNIFK